MEQELNIDKQGNNLDGEGVFLVKEGFVHGWVCAPKSMTLQQVEEAINTQGYVPAYCYDLEGNRSSWVPVAVTGKADPDMNSPGHCLECPDDRQHWLVCGGIAGLMLYSAGLGLGETMTLPDGQKVEGSDG